MQNRNDTLILIFAPSVSTFFSYNMYVPTSLFYYRKALYKNQKYFPK